MSPPRSTPLTSAKPLAGTGGQGWVWLLLVMVLACAVACWWVWVPSLEEGHLQQLQQWQAELARLHASQPLGLAAAYVALFTGLTALCLPGCGVLLLLGGGHVRAGVGQRAVGVGVHSGGHAHHARSPPCLAALGGQLLWAAARAF